MLTRNRELVKAIKENRLFDYIANHGYEYSKQELIEIIKELTYNVHCFLNMIIENKAFNNSLIDDLFDYTYLFGRNDDNMTEDEKVYERYKLGIDTYEDYLRVCEFLGCEPLPEVKED